MRRWLLAGAALAVGVVVIRQVLALPAVHDVLVTTAADLRGMIAEVKDGLEQR
jgi:hypothetical protein